MVARLLLVGAVVGAVAVGWCDSITVGDRTYKDVLVRASPNFYYVTLPNEGRVLTVPLSDVDPATVSINNDITYRNALKSAYEANRQNPPERSYSSLDQSQVAAEAQAAVNAANESQFELPAEAPESGSPGAGGGVAAGGGLGVSAAQLQAAVQGAGVTMADQGTQAGHPKFFGRSASGNLQVDAYGPEENLKNITIVVTAADAGQLLGQLGALAQVIQQAAPWAQQWFAQNQAALMTGSPIEATQNNVHVSVIPGQSGASISLTITMEAVG